MNLERFFKNFWILRILNLSVFYKGCVWLFFEIILYMFDFFFKGIYLINWFYVKLDVVVYFVVSYN